MRAFFVLFSLLSISSASFATVPDAQTVYNCYAESMSYIFKVPVTDSIITPALFAAGVVGYDYDQNGSKIERVYDLTSPAQLLKLNDEKEYVTVNHLAKVFGGVNSGMAAYAHSINEDIKSGTLYAKIRAIPNCQGLFQAK